MPSGGSRHTRQYVQNPSELDSMPTPPSASPPEIVGIESSSSGFWTYCLVRLEPPDGIATVHKCREGSNVESQEEIFEFNLPGEFDRM